MFELYKSVSDKFYKENSVYIERYPFAMMCLEKIIRMDIAGKKNLVARDIDLYSEFSVKAFVLLVSKKILLALFRFFPLKKIVVISAPRFDDVRNKLSEELKNKGYICLKNNVISKFIISSSFRGRLCLVKEFRRFNNGYQDGEINEESLKRLNVLVKREVYHLAHFLDRLNVKVVFVDGDSSPVQRIICKASELARCKVIVLAHGYVQSPSLITIAPIYGDFLCVWSEKQKLNLLSVLDTDSSRKVLYVGGFFRKKGIEGEKKASKPHALFGLEPLPKTMSAKHNYLKIIKNYCKKLNEAGYDVVCRPHPKENVDIVKEIGFEISGVRVSSKGTAIEALSACDVFLSPNSSMLVQAGYMGKPSLQISELRCFEFEGAELVSLDNIGDKLSDISNFVESGQAGVESFFDVSQVPLE